MITIQLAPYEMKTLEHLHAITEVHITEFRYQKNDHNLYWSMQKRLK
jgi:hypothetical protein